MVSMSSSTYELEKLAASHEVVVDNLRKSHDSFEALKVISFTAHDGEVFGLMGLLISRYRKA